MSPEKVAAARVKDVLGRIQLTGKTSEPVRGNFAQSVAAVLRDAILDGALEAGAWLREIEVSRELKVSRTPVRDAFRILDSEGLVHISANQGAVVTRMDIDDFIELYVVREVLESLAARLATRRAPQQCRDELSGLLEPMSAAVDANKIEELRRLNSAFHTVILDAAGNRYLQRALGPILNVMRRSPDPTLGVSGQMKESLQEHVDLAEAIGSGNEDEAARQAMAHMQHLPELLTAMRKAIRGRN